MILQYSKPAYILYPSGTNLNYTLNYTKEVSKIILKTFESGSFYLIARGSSGAILSALVAKDLCDNDRDVSIIISRKQSESSHGENMEDINLANKPDSHIIVIDDLIDTGNTIIRILNDLDYHGFPYPEMLCISNSSGNLAGKIDSNYEVIKNSFKYITCNPISNV